MLELHIKTNQLLGQQKLRAELTTIKPLNTAELSLAWGNVRASYSYRVKREPNNL